MVQIAYKTLKAIDQAIQADDGAKFRYYEGLVFPHLPDAYDSKPYEPRGHLGASILGRDCGREIAYSWRWAAKPKHGSRLLRLFNRGHLEEARFVALLLMIGCQVYQVDSNGKQFRVSFAGEHGGGSGDGVAVGIPDLQPGSPALSEFKTHAEKSFIELAGPLKDWRNHLANPRLSFVGKGVRAAKFEHFVQMQIYMRLMAIPQAIYIAVNKNTDDIYAEIVTLDTAIADEFIARGDTIVWSNGLPTRINKSPGFFKCKFCDYRNVCHLGAPLDKNCRTCQFSAPLEGGVWSCGKYNVTLDKQRQMLGCESWQQIEQ